MEPVSAEFIPDDHIPESHPAEGYSIPRISPRTPMIPTSPLRIQSSPSPYSC